MHESLDQPQPSPLAATQPVSPAANTWPTELLRVAFQLSIVAGAWACWRAYHAADMAFGFWRTAPRSLLFRSDPAHWSLVVGRALLEAGALAFAVAAVAWLLAWR